MAVTKEAIKKLREISNAGIMDCREALIKAKGDLNKAIEIMREKGTEIALRKASRPAKEGLVEAYIHTGGKIGVLIEVNCETDFVARNDDFKTFVKDVAMQIAALNPLYLSSKDVPKEVVKRESEHLEKYYREVCLLEQAFIKDEKITIKDYLISTVAKLGENIVIRRFVRYELGEE